MYEFENTLTKFFTENYFLPISAQGLSAFSVAGLSAVILVGRRSAVSLEGPSEIEIKKHFTPIEHPHVPSAGATGQAEGTPVKYAALSFSKNLTG